MSRFCGRIASARVPVFIGASLGQVIQQPQITGPRRNSAGGAGTGLTPFELFTRVAHNIVRRLANGHARRPRRRHHAQLNACRLLKRIQPLKRRGHIFTRSQDAMIA